MEETHYNWDTMKPYERDRLVHDKVMNQPILCPGEIRLLRNPMDWYCDECLQSWVQSEVEDYHTFTHFIRKIPPYTQSMDAAWLVFQHMMQVYYPTRDEWRGPHYPIFRVFAEELMWFDNGSATYGDEIYPSEYFFQIVAHWTPELLCKAVLKALGIVSTQHP